jgi:hypothetical protein
MTGKKKDVYDYRSKLPFFLLAVGELSGGVIHVDALLQNYEARAPRYRVVVRPLDRSGIGIGHSLPDDWEFGVILQHMT